MQRFINTMVLGVTALTLTVLSTSAAFADGKGGHSGNSHGSPQGSFKQSNIAQGQGQHFAQNNQVKKLNQPAHNTLKQTNLTQNFNHTNGSQFKKTGGPGKDFKKDYCWDKYCHNYCYNNWWGCWNYGCWDSCYNSYCGFYPCLSYYPYCCKSYCFPVRYTVSPVFATEIVIPEVVVPQLVVKEVPVTVVGPAAIAPVAKPGLTQNAPMNAIETVDTSFVTGSIAGNK